MADELYNWEIKVIRDRFNYLNLSFEQAEKVYMFEQEKDTPSDKHFFSIWEEWDFERDRFADILNQEQLTEHDRVQKETIRQYERHLIESDRTSSIDIAYNQELLNFYKTDLLPEYFKFQHRAFIAFTSETAKIEYLKKEYKRFLDNNKKGVLVNHFRHNRTFKPLELKAALLRHKLMCMLPDINHFRLEMDEPTRIVTEYLLRRFRFLPDEIEDLLARKFSQLDNFHEQTFKKHYEQTGGWHATIREPTNAEVRQNRAMTLLLLDERGYRS